MILLKNVNIKGQGNHDVLIEGQRIKQISDPNTIQIADAQIVDLTGKILLPGLVDLHTHLREPGREDSET
ncbi:MAG: dihydroorotase, partial [Candidatus Nanopelagicales bacterium]